jgi:hypothetical protein
MVLLDQVPLVHHHPPLKSIHGLSKCKYIPVCSAISHLLLFSATLPNFPC